MVALDWIFVVFGVVVAATGAWLQFHPERILPPRNREAEWPAAWSELQIDARAKAQIRVLGSCFLFMGMFFAVQMTVDLTRLPWWTGTIGGLATAFATVSKVNAHVSQSLYRNQRRVVQQTSLPKKVLELR